MVIVLLHFSIIFVFSLDINDLNKSISTLGLILICMVLFSISYYQFQNILKSYYISNSRVYIGAFTYSVISMVFPYLLVISLFQLLNFSNDYTYIPTETEHINKSLILFSTILIGSNVFELLFKDSFSQCKIDISIFRNHFPILLENLSNDKLLNEHFLIGIEFKEVYDSLCDLLNKSYICLNNNIDFIVLDKEKNIMLELLNNLSNIRKLFLRYPKISDKGTASAELQDFFLERNCCTQLCENAKKSKIFLLEKYGT